MCSAVCYNPHQTRLRPFSIQIFTYCSFLPSCSFYWNISPVVMEKSHRNLPIMARFPGFLVFSISFLTSRTNHLSLTAKLIELGGSWRTSTVLQQGGIRHEEPCRVGRATCCMLSPAMREAPERLQRGSFSGLLLLLKTLLSPS